MNPESISQGDTTEASVRHIAAARLRRDPFVLGSAVLAAVIATIYATRPFPETWLSWISDSGGSAAWMILFIGAALHGLRRIDRKEEIRFWCALALAWTAWLAGELIMLTGWIDPLSATGGVSIDCIFFLYYLGWLYALEQRPDRGRSPAMEELRRLGFAVRSVFAIGLFLYFVVLPPVFLPENYLTWLPSYLFYVILDLYIFGRLAGAGVSSASPRWRTLYSILAVGALFIALTDTLEALWVMELITLPFATAVDFLWYLPMFLCVVGARMRHLWPEEPQPPGQDPEGEVRGVPVLAYSVAFPAIHLAMDLVGESPIQIVRQRTVLVLIWLLILGIISIEQFRRINSLNRKLRRRRREAEEKIQFLLRHDELTGLHNRREIEQLLDDSIDRERRLGGILAVLFIDLDDFKAVNDNWGHGEGDEILREVARRIRECVRSIDRAGRYGGDEFVVVLEPIEHPEDASHVADRILAALAVPRPIRSQQYEIRASVGIAVFPRDGDTREALIARADEAMYQAKAAGGRGAYSPADGALTEPETRWPGEDPPPRTA